MLRQSQKMEAIGTLAGGIAHDFNNLLTGIFGYTEILRTQLEDNPDSEESIDVIEKAATRARQLTSKLLGFARKSRYQGVWVDLNATILEVASLLKGTVDKKIAIYTNLNAVLPVVTGDPDQLSHVLLNLAMTIRKMTESLLKSMGYSVMLATDGANALQIYQQHFNQIDLVIVDMVMPVMGGTECIRGLKEINPKVKIILSTGYSRETVAEQINSTELSGFLPKFYNKQQRSRANVDSLPNQVRH